MKWPWSRQQLAGIFESFKAGSSKKDTFDWETFNFTEYSQKCDALYKKEPKLRAHILTIAGQVMAEGIFLQVKEEYDRANEAKDICEKFNVDNNVEIKTHDTALRMGKYGSAFWEITDTPEFSVRLVPFQKYMHPVFDEDTHELSKWQYKVGGDVRAEWDLDHIILFPHDVNDYPPFGTSLFTGIDREVNTVDSIVENTRLYLLRQAWATNVLQVGDKDYHPTMADKGQIQSKFKNRQVGEDLVTDFPIELKVMATGPAETRMIPDTLKFLDDQLSDAMLVPPLSKLYNSTEASATVMADWCRAVIITPFQRIIKRILEEKVYWPLLESQGFSHKVVPEVTFEPADVNKVEDSNYWIGLVNAGLCSREEACQELGTDFTLITAEKEKAIAQQQDLLRQKSILQKNVLGSSKDNPGQSQQDSKAVAEKRKTWKVTQLDPDS